MNKTFKIVFNKTRGALMVANELTSSVQAKGTKTVIAMTVATLMAGGAIAGEIGYEQNSGSTGYSAATQTQQEFAADDILNMTITGSDTRAYGLLATGEGSGYTNKGTINVNLATKGASNPWQVKGMMADNNGTAVNGGTINVTNAYGMTVGSTGVNTLTNNGKIDVKSGVGMEVAPTGIQGSGKEGSNAAATNNGSITVADGAIGILMSGTGNTFTNQGTLDATKQAVLLQQEKGKSASNNQLIFESGSTTNGKITVGGNVTKTTIEFKKGAAFDGAIVVDSNKNGVSGTTLTAKGQTFSGQSNGAIQFYDGRESKIQLTDVNFSDNQSNGGGAVYTYAEAFDQVGGSYKGNKAVSTGVKLNGSTVNDGAMGGALFIKGSSPVNFTNVEFTNNSAVAKQGTEKDVVGGQAYGGAILADYSTGNNGDVPGAADLIFKVTKDMTYAGNTVSSDSSGSTGLTFDTYGYCVPTAAAGGFLFLDRGASAAFNVEKGATLTLGSTVTGNDTTALLRPFRIRVQQLTKASTPSSRRKVPANSSSTAIWTSITVRFR